MGAILGFDAPDGDDDRTAEVTAFHQAARWVGVHDGDRQEWLKARSKLITASRVASILGLGGYDSAMQVYADFVCPRPPEPDEVPDLKSKLFWGKALERTIAETAAEAFGWELRMSGKLLVSRSLPELGCTLDGEIKVDGVWGAYEGKTWDAMARRDWNEDTGQAPDHVLIQCHSQLIVTKAPFDYACALIGGNMFAKVLVEPNAELHDFIRAQVLDFMDRVRRLEPPPVSHRDEDAIRQLYPHESGRTIELTSEQAEWMLEAQRLATLRIASEKREKELKNMLRLAMGEASFAELPAGMEAEKRVAKCVTEGRGERVLRFVKSRFSKDAPKASTRMTVLEPKADLEGIDEDKGNVVRFRGRRRAPR